jgi:polyhydroxyalkanoate synthase subunit PhaC
MPGPEHSDISFPDAVQLFRSFARVAERSRTLVLDFLMRAPEFSGLRMADQRIGEAFFKLTAKMLSDPVALARAQIDLWTEHARLWTTSTQRVLGLADDSADMRPLDARFTHPAWSELAIFDYIKQSYIITAESILSMVRGVEGLDKNTAHKVDFYTRQFVDAIAPSNFIATNPEVLKATLESGGQNLLNGLANLLRDNRES